MIKKNKLISLSDVLEIFQEVVGDSCLLNYDTELMDSGIVDSFGIIEIQTIFETKFNINFESFSDTRTIFSSAKNFYEIVINQNSLSDWNSIYNDNKGLSIWPWSDVVSNIYKFKKEFINNKILELGVGAGANIPLFELLGYDFYGIDYSEISIEKISSKFPKSIGNLACGDFTESIPFSHPFALVFDRASMCHNTRSRIYKSIEMISSIVASGSFYMGFTWFSKNHPASRLGINIESHTRKNIPTNQFESVGIVGFFDEQEIISLFEGMGWRVIEIVEVSYIQSKHIENSNIYFNFIAIKK